MVSVADAGFARGGLFALKLPSQYISRNHAEIARREDGLWLTDLGSASGTKLNGERMNARDPRRINVGDRIEFADVRAEVRAA